MRQSKAFTLIELLVVIAIIGFIASIVLVNLQGVRGRGRIAAGKQFSSTLQHTLGAYAVGIWRFEDGSGTTALDSSGYINNGTLNGGAIWRTETECGLELGGCLEFDGVDDHVNAGSSNNLQTNSAVTQIAWVNPDGVSGSNLIIRAGQGFDLQYSMYVTDGKLLFHWYNGSSFSAIATDSTITQDVWTHVAIAREYDGLTLYFYINGVLVKTDIMSTQAPDIGGVLSIGGHTNPAVPQFFNGTIDDVHIFTTSLTTAQIEQLYVQGMQKHQFAQQ